MRRSVWILALMASLSLAALWAQAEAPAEVPPAAPAAVAPGPWWQTPELAALQQQARAACAELYRLETATPRDESAIARQRAVWDSARQEFWALRNQQRTVTAPAVGSAASQPGRGCYGAGPGYGPGGPGYGAGPGYGRGGGPGYGRGSGCGRGGGRGCCGANPNRPYRTGN